jgi:ribosomal protein S18 acetylase RimI-like enzyme
MARTSPTSTLFPLPDFFSQVYPPYSPDTTDERIPAIATIVCKQDFHKSRNRGYIAMLSVDKNWRRRGIGKSSLKL